MSLPSSFVRRLRWFGVVALLISLGTWALDLSGLVYVCPYCRVQRTAIGLLGLLMLLPEPGRWYLRYVACVIGLLGAVVASNQHFAGWQRISAGNFSLGEAWYFNSFLLSGAALMIIVAQLMLIHAARPAAARLSSAAGAGV